MRSGCPQRANRRCGRGIAPLPPTQIHVLSRVLQGTAGGRDGSDSLHHINIDLLKRSYLALARDAAPGTDGVTWQAYGEPLEEKLKDLHDRVHRGSYRARPARRTYIPKADGSKRPLCILCLEDKIVQQAVVYVLEAIYEEDFLGFSYGFRPGRGQHDALDALHAGIYRKQVNPVCPSGRRTMLLVVLALLYTPPRSDT